MKDTPLSYPVSADFFLYFEGRCFLVARSSIVAPSISDPLVAFFFHRGSLHLFFNFFPEQTKEEKNRFWWSLKSGLGWMVVAVVVVVYLYLWLVLLQSGLSVVERDSGVFLFSFLLTR